MCVLSAGIGSMRGAGDGVGLVRSRSLEDTQCRRISAEPAADSMWVARPRSAGTRHPANIANCLNDELRLVSLDPMATLLCEAIFAPWGTLRQILLKLGPDAIPGRKLLFRHAIGLRVASIARGVLEGSAATNDNQRDFRLPLQLLAWFHVPSDSGHDFVWGRSGGIEFVQAQRLFLVSRVQEHKTGHFPRVASLEAPDIDSRIGMAHQHEWPFFARGLQPCVQIVDHLIDGL